MLKPPLGCALGVGFRVWGLGFGVWGLGFGVWGLGFGVWVSPELHVAAHAAAEVTGGYGGHGRGQERAALAPRYASGV